MGNIIRNFLRMNEAPPEPKSDRIVGKIIKLSSKGWGFISSKDIEFTRIFFHWTELNQDTLNFKELDIGMKVEFTPLKYHDKGWRALKISVIERDDDELESNHDDR